MSDKEDTVSVRDDDVFDSLADHILLLRGNSWASSTCKALEICRCFALMYFNNSNLTESKSPPAATKMTPKLDFKKPSRNIEPLALTYSFHFKSTRSSRCHQSKIFLSQLWWYWNLLEQSRFTFILSLLIGWFNQRSKVCLPLWVYLWRSEAFLWSSWYFITSTIANIQATENPELSDWFQAGLRHLEA